MLKCARKSEFQENQSTRLARRFQERKAVAPGKVRRPLDIAEDIRSARLWLACGAPIADVMTMLEICHRFELSPDDCRADAIEILWAAQSESRTEANPKSTAKELPYATA